jgi:cation diffusion facilitator CzcD-associated flavoprotein CzcO
MSTKYTEVLCIGVGLSGVCLGVQLQRKYKFTDIHFYERNASHSGTWYVNRYPDKSTHAPLHVRINDIGLGCAW